MKHRFINYGLKKVLLIAKGEILYIKHEGSQSALIFPE